MTIEVGAEAPLPASGEERAVIQILVNLISNAVRHSPDKGIVALAFARTAGTASVTVSDQGPGIDSADQQRIFERFERAHAKEGGNGPRACDLAPAGPLDGRRRHPRKRAGRRRALHADASQPIIKPLILSSPSKRSASKWPIEDGPSIRAFGFAQSLLRMTAEI